jgi:hypothetical protein
MSRIVFTSNAPPWGTAGKERAAGLKLTDGRLDLVDHVAAVQLLGDVHAGKARHGVAVSTTTAPGRCPVLWQQRRGDIDAAVLRQVDDLVGMIRP